MLKYLDSNCWHASGVSGVRSQHCGEASGNNGAAGAAPGARSLSVQPQFRLLRSAMQAHMAHLILPVPGDALAMHLRAACRLQ